MYVTLALALALAAALVSVTAPAFAYTLAHPAEEFRTPGRAMVIMSLTPVYVLASVLNVAFATNAAWIMARPHNSVHVPGIAGFLYADGYLMASIAILCLFDALTQQHRFRAVVCGTFLMGNVANIINVNFLERKIHVAAFSAAVSAAVLLFAALLVAWRWHLRRIEPLRPQDVA